MSAKIIWYKIMYLIIIIISSSSSSRLYFMTNTF